MKPSVNLSGLKKPRWWEYALRFGFGGVITAATGLIARHFGPVIGGLFLGFPAILPASLTLVKRHDGSKKTFEDACGARLGSVSLVLFGTVAWALAARAKPLVLLLVASVAWLFSGVVLWMTTYGRR